MTQPADTTDIAGLLALDAAEAPPKGSRRLAAAGIIVLLLVVLASMLAVRFMVDSRRADLLHTLENRLEVLATGEAAVISTWLDGVVRLGVRITESDLFRLFAAEVDLAGLPQEGPLADQVRYMREVMDEFTRQSGLVGAYVVAREGKTVLTAPFAPELAEERAMQAAAVGFATAAPTFLPLRQADGDLVLDVLLPITPPQASEGTASREVAGVLVMSVPAGQRLAEILAPGPLAQPGERVRLLQAGPDDEAQEVRADSRSLAPLPGTKLRPLPFGVREAVRADGPVFSVGAPVLETGWLVVQEVDRAQALAPLERFRWSAGGAAALGALVLAAAFVAFWWRLHSAHNHTLALQYRDLAARIDAQRQLLDGINNAISEHIGLKGPDGRYRYVNPAFAAALGRPVAEIEGLQDADIFGEQAWALRELDETAVEKGEAHAPEAEFRLGGRMHFLEISRVPLLAPAGTVKGIVTVSRDVTERVEQRRARERALRNTIAALVHTVEMSDPYLAGHSRLVRRYSLAVAERLGLDERQRDTLEIAANLAQIGKLSVPREILTKTARLTPEEIRIMQSHIEHASRVLRDIDFDGLPVHDAVYAMYERLDGSGYPRGLADGDIPLLARVLGAVDVFAARIQPRSYRAAIAPEEAIGILEMNTPQRYDAEVVAALREVIASAPRDDEDEGESA